MAAPSAPSGRTTEPNTLSAAVVAELGAEVRGEAFAGGRIAFMKTYDTGGLTTPHGDILTLDAVDLLLRAGAKVNAANDNGVTPLALACENGSGALVTPLLKAGANANGVTLAIPAATTAACNRARGRYRARRTLSRNGLLGVLGSIEIWKASRSCVMACSPSRYSRGGLSLLSSSGSRL